MGFSERYADREPGRAEIDQISGPLLLEFGAPWWGYCLELQPQLADLMNSYPHVRHIKVYDGRGKPLGRSFRVKLWPTFVLLRDGQIIERLVRTDAEMLRAGFLAFTKDAGPQATP